MEFVTSVVAKNLRFCRMDAGLKLEEVAAGTGCTASSVSRYEQGKRCPTVVVAVCLCRFYGVSLDWLVKVHRYE